MNLERLDQLNTKLDALEAQDNALNAELSSASEYERSQIRSQKSNLNNQRVRLWQEKEALKKTLLRDAQNAVVAAEMALRHCTERAAVADNAHQVVSRVMADVDRLALEFKNALVAEMNGTAGPRERVRGNFANAHRPVAFDGRPHTTPAFSTGAKLRRLPRPRERVRFQIAPFQSARLSPASAKSQPRQGLARARVQFEVAPFVPSRAAPSETGDNSLVSVIQVTPPATM